MNYNYEFSYIKCQSCPGKSHCQQCEDELTAALDPTFPGIRVSINEKRIDLTTDMDEDEVIEYLEDEGLFIF